MLVNGGGVCGWQLAVCGSPFAVDGWRWIVWWPGLQATNETYATHETYGGRRSNRKPQTANGKPPTPNRFAQIDIVPEPVRRDRPGRRDH